MTMSEPQQHSVIKNDSGYKLLSLVAVIVCAGLSIGSFVYTPQQPAVEIVLGLVDIAVVNTAINQFLRQIIIDVPASTIRVRRYRGWQTVPYAAISHFDIVYVYQPQKWFNFYPNGRKSAYDQAYLECDLPGKRFRYKFPAPGNWRKPLGKHYLATVLKSTGKPVVVRGKEFPYVFIPGLKLGYLQYQRHNLFL